MKKKPGLTKELLGGAAVIQAILLTAVWVLQNLAHQKAGVNHHLQFRKTSWMHAYLTDRNVLLATVILSAAAMILIFLLIRSRNKRNPAAKTAAVLTVLWIGAGLFAMYSPAARELLVYPYLLLALGCALLVSAVPTAAGILQSRNKP